MGDVVQDSIQALMQERERIDAALEALRRLNELRKRRTLELPEPRRAGRKSMGTAERLEVSARMRRYWANWRKRTASAD